MKGGPNTQSNIIQLQDALDGMDLGINLKNQTLLREVLDQMEYLLGEVKSLKAILSEKGKQGEKDQQGPIIVGETRKLSRGTLAKRWECSISTVRRREKAGEIAAERNGGIVRYDLDEILRFEREILYRAVD